MSLFDRIFHRDDEETDNLSIYKDEPSTNRFASFLFGFFALFVTLLIAGGLFFGGRAVYRTLNGSEDNGVAVPAQKDNNAQSAQKASSQSSDQTKKPESSKKSTKKTGSTPSTGDNLPNTGDTVELPKTGDPGM